MQQLLLSHATLMTTPFQRRVRAAAAAEFPCVSIFLSDVGNLLHAGKSYQFIADVAARNGVLIRDIELLSGWIFTSGDAERDYRAHEEFAFSFADAVGAKSIQATAPVGADPDHAARQFGMLSDRAAAHGLDVALECMPHTDLPNLASAWRIIEGAARDNGGLRLDAFHLFHAGDTVDAVARLPRAAIKAVQLNDGPPAPFVDYEQAMVSQRVACGDGEFPLRELLDALDGISCPLSIEVFNSALWRTDPIENAMRHAEKLCALLGAEAPAPAHTDHEEG